MDKDTAQELYNAVSRQEALQEKIDWVIAQKGPFPFNSGTYQKDIRIMVTKAAVLKALRKEKADAARLEAVILQGLK